MRRNVAPKEAVRVLVVDLERDERAVLDRPTGLVQPVLEALAAAGVKVVGVAPGRAGSERAPRWVGNGPTPGVGEIPSAAPRTDWGDQGQDLRADVTVLCGPLPAARRWLERHGGRRGWRPVLVVASAPDPTEVRDLLRMCASGWVGSPVSASSLESAVMAVAAGSVVLPGEAAWQVLQCPQ